MIHSKAAGDLGQILSSGHKIKNIKIPDDLYEPVFLSGDTSALTTAMYLTKKIMMRISLFPLIQWKGIIILFQTLVLYV